MFLFRILLESEFLSNDEQVKKLQLQQGTSSAEIASELNTRASASEIKGYLFTKKSNKWKRKYFYVKDGHLLCYFMNKVTFFISPVIAHRSNVISSLYFISMYYNN